MGKTILFTGVSSGFGRLAVPLLLDKGHTVIAGIRGGEERLRSLYDEAHLATGRLTALDLHMERPESFAAVAEHVAERHDGRLDVLINNAGYGALAPIEDFTDEQLRHQMEVNFFGPMLLTRALLDALRAARGRVINVSSAAAFMSFPYYGVYSASKQALEAISDAWAAELKPFGVQVGIVEPGGYKTEFTGTAVKAVEIPEGSQYAARTEAFNEFLVKAEAQGGGNPIVVARKLVRLCDVRRVPARTISGPDAHALSFLNRLIPDRLRAWLTWLVFSKLFWKGR